VSFEPRPDPRPDDVVWPEARWPPAPDVVLAGEVVRLTPTVDADLPQLWSALDDERVWEHLPMGRPAEAAALGEVLGGMRERGFHPWTLRLRQAVGALGPGAVVGWSSYLDVSPSDARCEIGATAYAVAVWGSAVNPDAKLQLLAYAFDVLGMGRVQLKTDVRNARSQRAIAGIGATYEGVLRRFNRRADGTVRDSVLFSVTAEEWPAVREHLVARVSAHRPQG